MFDGEKTGGYGLTPLQEGMLYHQLSQGGEGVDIEQISIKISHSLNKENFHKAWLILTEHHDILRTAFSWDSEQENRQVIQQDVIVPLKELDWSAYNEIDFTAKLNEFAEADRLSDFNLAEAPLMRLALILAPNNIFYCVWTFHHILLDGRSFPLILKELFAIYESLENGEGFSFATRVDFSAYVSWLGERDKSKEHDFWSKELQGIDSGSSLRLQKDRSEAQDEKYGFQELQLSSQETTLLNEFAKQQKVTLNTLLQAAWSLILHHYSREKDIVFGSTRACRHGGVEGADNILGLLINTVPFRVVIDDQLTLLDLLQQVRNKHILLRDFEFTPLQDIRKAAQIKSELMFETLLVFDSNTLNDRMQEPGGDWLQREFQYRGQTNFPLALIAYGGDELSLRLEFDREKYCDEKISGLLTNLKQLLLNFPKQSDSLASQVDCLTTEQISKLTSETVGEYEVRYQEAESTIASLFEDIVERIPDKQALCFESQNLSFLELNQRANGLANLLIEQGVVVGDFIGVCCERSIELIVSLLGIIKAGAAYVPLDPDYPVDRLDFTIGDANVKIVLTQNVLKNKLASSNAKIICVDEQAVPLVDKNPTLGLNPEHLAYVLYTSGSTGRPKGVMNSHRGIVNRLIWMRDEYQVTQDDIVLQKTPYSFDVSVWEFFLPVISGATMVLVKPGGHKDGVYLADIIQQKSVTLLHFVPSMLRLFLDEENLNLSCKTVRNVICSGEALMPDLCERFFAKMPSALHNLYGPTEAAVDVTYWQCTPENSSSIVPIGHVVANTYLYVLDKYLRPVPEGQIGELYIGGVQVAKGYLNRDELTAQCFIADPYNEDKNARLYKTGDLGRRREDGAFEYHGRIDYQVKLRGMRIELGEIEVAIEENEKIKQAVVLVREDSPGVQKLVAYLSFHPELDIHFTVKEFRRFLESRLPEHMVPAAFVILENFPLTISGKVDRKLLPLPENDRPELGQEYIAPRSETEKNLVEVWQKVLGLEKIGIRDDYFDLGGDSILTIKIVAQLKKRGYTLSPKQVFQNKTIEALAKKLTPLIEVSINQDKVSGRVGLLPAQKWFFQQDLEKVDYWNQAFLFDLEKPLDRSFLKKSLVILVDHHDEFRAAFSKNSGDWEKNIGDQVGELELHHYDLSLESSESLPRIVSTHCETLQASLDISRAELFAFAYFEMPENIADKLFICFHHLVVDGVSWNIILQDIETNYFNLLENRSIASQSKTSSMKDWLEALNKYSLTQNFLSNLEYWQQMGVQKFDKIPNLDLSENKDCHLKSILVKLDADKTGALLRRCHRPYGTQINDLLLAALTDSLSKVFQLRNFTIDVEGHGREDLFSNIDLSRSIAWFTSIYPVSFQLKKFTTWKNHILSTKEALRAVPNQGFDFLLRRYLTPQLTSGQNTADFLPTSDVLFNYMGQFDQTLADTSLFKFSELASGPWHGQENHRTHALEILGWVKKDCLEFSLGYSDRCFKEDELVLLGQLFEEKLLALIEHCESTEIQCFSPSDFPLLEITQEEIDRIYKLYPSMINVYPMSAMQKLFYAADVIDPMSGFEQWQFSFEGKLEVDKYKSAWQAVVDKHDILRTCFVKDRDGEALQVVVGEAPLDWAFVDLSAHSSDDKKNLLQDIVKCDKEKCFQLDKASLVRIVVIQLAENQFHFIWSTHHLCIDGWSWPLVFKDVRAAYQDQTQTHTPQFNEYITWLSQQDFGSIRRYWSELLAGYQSTIAFDSSSELASKNKVQKDYTFDSSLSAVFNDYAKNAGVTVSTLFQGLWSLVLGRASGRKDIVFGISSSGRPHDISDVSEIVGPFVNNIPNRISLEKVVEDSLSTRAWLQSIQDVNLNSGLYEMTPLLEIQQCSELPLSQRLFESLLVFQNYTSDESTESLSDAIKIIPVDLPQSTNYPLTLAISPGENILVSGYFQSGYFSEQEIDALFQDLESVAREIVQDVSLADIFFEEGAWRVREKILRDAESTDDVSIVGGAKDQLFSSMIEKEITLIWLDAFGVTTISRTRSFFELGGQSIMLVAVHAQIQEQLKVKFSITDFFKYPSIEKLSSFLNKSENDQKEDTLDSQNIRDKAQLKKLAMRKKKMKSRKPRNVR